jgi:hypothetical protein
MIRIGQLFTVAYGDKRYENKSRLRKSRSGTPLVAAGGRNNGIIGRFAIPATKKHILTVTRTGAGSVGKAFYHGYPCEVNSDALVLTPRKTMLPDEMLWYARLITANRFRFSFGRKMTPSRLEAIEVPEPGEPPFTFPAPSLSANVDRIVEGMDRLSIGQEGGLKADLSLPSTVGQLFDVIYGNSYELCHLKLDPAGVNFVSHTARNNGISGRVARTEDEPFPVGNLTVALGGSVLESWVQFAPFYTGRDVAVLKPKAAMSVEEKLFCCVAIKLHRFRFSYGRQANTTLATLTIPALPAWVKDGQVEQARAQLVRELKNVG